MPRWNGDQPGAEGRRASRRVPAAAARSSEWSWAIIAQSRKRGALCRAAERARGPPYQAILQVPCSPPTSERQSSGDSLRDGGLPATPPPRLFSRRVTLRDRASPLQGGEPWLEDPPGPRVCRAHPATLPGSHRAGIKAEPAGKLPLGEPLGFTCGPNLPAMLMAAQERGRHPSPQAASVPGSSPSRRASSRAVRPFASRAARRRPPKVAGAGLGS